MGKRVKYCVVVFAGLAALFAVAVYAGVPVADDAWRAIQTGNARFAADQSTVRQYAARRAELVGGQQPRMVVLGCADSRVPPELVFDQGLGDLFVVRSAGNVMSPIELGSIEYALEHLKATLVVVLGHEQCGAVKATMAAVKAGGGPVPGNIGAIVDEIAPVVRAAATDNVEVCVNGNVQQVISTLFKRSPVVREMYEGGRIRVIGAKYSLTTGKVEVLFDGEAVRRLL